MTVEFFPDALRELVEPFIPVDKAKPNGGSFRLADRACLTGFVFVLRSRIPWEMLPQEMGRGSGMSCWRRLRDWQARGIWQLLHFVLLDWLARSPSRGDPVSVTQRSLLLTDLAVQISRSGFLKLTHRFPQACVIRGQQRVPS